MDIEKKTMIIGLLVVLFGIVCVIVAQTKSDETFDNFKKSCEKLDGKIIFIEKSSVCLKKESDILLVR